MPGNSNVSLRNRSLHREEEEEGLVSYLPTRTLKSAEFWHDESDQLMTPQRHVFV